jgi:hypothetical protein
MAIVLTWENLLYIGILIAVGAGISHLKHSQEKHDQL